MIKCYSKHLSMALALAGFAALSGCGSSGGSKANTNSSPVAGASSSTVVVTSSSVSSSSDDLVALGKTAYEAQCQSCHGVGGIGGISPPIIIANGLPGGATDLATYIQTNMPPVDPASCGSTCASQIAAYINSWTSENFTTLSVAPNGYSIATIGNCGVNSNAAIQSTVFNATLNNLDGYTNITAGNAVFADLSLGSNNPLYQVPGVSATDATCNNISTQTMVLVKKYGDWNVQHANGIEISLANQNQTFADIDNIVIEFKVNSDSVILSKAELMLKYGTLITDAQYDELDQGKAVFAVSILGPNTGTNVQAERYIEIDQAVLADQWVRVTIPFAQMDLFTDQVWIKAPTTIAEQASTVADRIQINPDVLGIKTIPTTYGDVIRNLLGGPDDAAYAAMNIPESFKELSITVKNIEIQWK
jgi:mono/diheme cytochrome c family protein